MPESWVPMWPAPPRVLQIPCGYCGGPVFPRRKQIGAMPIFGRKQKERIRYMYETLDMTTGEIAKEFYSTSGTIRGYLIEMGVFRPRRNIYCPKRAETLEMYRVYLEEGLTLTQVAERFGLRSGTTVGSRFKSLNLECRSHSEALAHAYAIGRKAPPPGVRIDREEAIAA